MHPNLAIVGQRAKFSISHDRILGDAAADGIHSGLRFHGGLVIRLEGPNTMGEKK